jgi:hypothetical protein
MKHRIFVAARYPIAVTLSVLIVLASLFLPTIVQHESDLLWVGLGFPFRFVVQDQSRYTPPLPWQTRFYSPWENPTLLMWPQLLLNLVLAFGVVSVALYGCRLIRIRRYKHEPTVTANSRDL